jgi:hyperosmotically inducible protein
LEWIVMNKQRSLKTDLLRRAIRRAARILLIALGGLVALASANCESRSVTDSAITAAVKSKLAVSGGNDAINVNVDTRGGEVTLTGVVETQASKDQAERIAASVEGVTRVINNITIDTSGEYGAGEGAGMTASDLAISSKIKTRYVAEGLIGAKVGVKDGVVTLKGAVEDARMKARAESIARATIGVKDVKNLLKVRP